MKLAVTVWAAPIVTAQVEADPLHAPPHAAKLEPAMGAAVKVTTCPDGKLAVQVAPQSSPAGAEETVPAPVPVFVTLNAKLLGACAA